MRVAKGRSHNRGNEHTKAKAGSISIYFTIQIHCTMKCGTKGGSVPLLHLVSAVATPLSLSRSVLRSFMGVTASQPGGNRQPRRTSKIRLLGRRNNDEIAGLFFLS